MPRLLENAKGLLLPELSALAKQRKDAFYQKTNRLELRGELKVDYHAYLAANPELHESSELHIRRLYTTPKLAEALSSPTRIRHAPDLDVLSTDRIILKYKLVVQVIWDLIKKLYPNGLVDVFVPKTLYETPTPFDIAVTTGNATFSIETKLTVKAAIDRYIQDLEASGYMVKLYQINSGNHVDIRNKMIEDRKHALVGAVMIGSALPLAWFEMSNDFNGAAQFPCDLYFMNLDGTWTDADGDGMFDSLSGDVSPDVWVGRIVGNLPVTGKSEAQLICEYLSRNHFFRNRDMAKFPQRLLSWHDGVPHYRGLAYQDDDWTNPTETSYLDGNLTHERILNNTSTTTTAADYLHRISEIPGGFFYIHQMIHSGPTSLSFKTGSSWDADGVTNDELNATLRRGHFFNLFDCSAARFVENNFLGGMYAIASPYGLGAVGSTKTGAMGSFDVYYANLCGSLRAEDAALASDWDVVVGKKQTFGTAFLKWFRFIAKGGFSLDEQRWHFGMTYIGDPTLYADWTLNRGKP